MVEPILILCIFILYVWVHPKRQEQKNRHERCWRPLSIVLCAIASSGHAVYKSYFIKDELQSKNATAPPFTLGTKTIKVLIAKWRMPFACSQSLT